jgi:hypothetical protein
MPVVYVNTAMHLKGSLLERSRQALVVRKGCVHTWPAAMAVPPPLSPARLSSVKASVSSVMGLPLWAAAVGWALEPDDSPPVLVVVMVVVVGVVVIWRD